MTEMSMDHERCSELLSAFAAGRLDAAERALVEDHLAGCSECLGELAAVRALVEPIDAALSELERARLRRVVLEEAVPLPDQPRAQASPRRAKAFQLLGTAAVLAVVGGFAYLGLSGGDDEANFSTGADGGDVSEESGEIRGNAGGGRLRQEDRGFGGAADSAVSSGSESLTTKTKAPPAPLFDPDAGLLTTRRLDRLGRNGLSLVAFSRSYNAADVAALQQQFVEQLASEAPAARGRDIASCSTLVFERFRYSLPAYAALGDYEDRGNVIVLAYAWSDRDDGPLDRSMVWAWVIGDCDGVPVHYSTSTIRPRP